MPKYLGIGGPKTGSYSLHLALQGCGVDSVHDYQTNSTAHKLIREDKLDEARQLWSKREAYIDGDHYWSGPKLLEVVDADTIFIHHHRDVESAITSAMLHAIDNRLTASARSIAHREKWSDISTWDLRKVYHKAAHTAQQLRDAGRTVIDVNICEEHHTWETFCPLFGFEIPDGIEFPFSNTGLTRMQRLFDHYKQYGSKPAPADTLESYPPTLTPSDFPKSDDKAE